MIIFKQGDMFSEENVDFWVNTVNCNGVMGKGVALEFKKRYPKMFRLYLGHCREGVYQPGHCHFYHLEEIPAIIVNVATKKNWWENSHYGWISLILKKLRKELEGKKGKKVVMPALGCGNGGLKWDEVKDSINHSLADLDCEIIVYEPTRT